MNTITLQKINSRDGTPIAYYRSGVGPPLILVPGAGAASPTAWPAFSALAEKFTVVAVDRRGHGMSGDNPTYAIEREFEDIAAVIDSLEEPANVLGHSYGGICTLEAGLLTRNFHKLILYEPLSIALPGKPVYPEGFLDRLEAMLDAGDHEGVLEMHYREIAGMGPEEIEQFRSSPVWQERVATANTLPRELRADAQYRFDSQRFKNLHIPTLLLTGSDSRAFEKKGIEMLAAALPNSQVSVMKRQDHVAMYSAPELFLREVHKFLLEPENGTPIIHS